MTKFNLEKFKSGNKGITLIALIITIIVLLILAGITINALTGSDSAPAKANEAEQKNDIGSAKDQIAVSAINAKTTAYETAYVGNSVSAGNAATTIGQAVIDAVLPFNGTSTGKASIEVTQAETNSVKGDATITITTRDFEVEGTITIQDGILTWGEIEDNVPRIKLNKNDLTLAPGGTATLSVKFKQLEETTIEWTTSNANVATVSNGIVTIKPTANDDDTAVITAKATYGDKVYTATCNVLVAQVSTPATQSLINTPTMIGAAVMNYTANGVSNWKVFYATENEVFIICPPSGLHQITNSILNEYPNGSGDIADGSYGQIWNNKWITACKNETSGKSTNSNAKATAYLCDTTKWSNYAVAPATYAVGGPTYELLALSVKSKTNNETDISNNISATSTGYNRYSNGISYDSLYENGQYWIASPSTDTNYAYKMVGKWKNYCVIPSEYDKNESSVRPLVSIPMNKVKIIGNKVKIDK